MKKMQKRVESLESKNTELEEEKERLEAQDEADK